MQVSFASEKLQEVCESERELRRAYGKDCAKKVMIRLSVLRAAPTLGVMRNAPGRCHELKGRRKGQLALEVTGGRRLVIEPADGWPDTEEDTDPWSEIDSIRVVEIVDYHDG